MTHSESDLFSKFEALDIEPGEFGHREHVQTAWEMLQKYPYIEACSRYANTIHTIASRAGAVGKFNVTITFAFLSLIAERLHESRQITDFEDFIAHNEDLLSKDALKPWYSDTQLQSEFARTHFQLPDQPLRRA